MDSNNHDLRSRDAYDDEPSKRTGARRRWPWAVGAVALAAAAFAGGVAVAGNHGITEPAPAAGPTAGSDGADSVPGPDGDAVAHRCDVGFGAVRRRPQPRVGNPAPSAGAWQTFTSAETKVSFDTRRPGRWHPRLARGPMRWTLTLRMRQAWWWRPCTPGRPAGSAAPARAPVPYTVLDSVEVDVPLPAHARARSRRGSPSAPSRKPDRVTASYGLTEHSRPARTAPPACSTTSSTAPPESPLFSFADTFQVNAGGSEQSHATRAPRRSPRWTRRGPTCRPPST